MNKIAAYIRVSKKELNVENQRRAIIRYCQAQGWVVDYWFIDEGFSGATLERPEFEKMMDRASYRDFDKILVYKFDRISRNMMDLLSVYRKIKEYHIDLLSVTEYVDTTNPYGKLLFYMIGAFAEFEREMTIMRTKEGLARAKASGQKLGRRKI